MQIVNSFYWFGVHFGNQKYSPKHSKKTVFSRLDFLSVLKFIFEGFTNYFWMNFTCFTQGRKGEYYGFHSTNRLWADLSFACFCEMEKNLNWKPTTSACVGEVAGESPCSVNRKYSFWRASNSSIFNFSTTKLWKDLCCGSHIIHSCPIHDPFH